MKYRCELTVPARSNAGTLWPNAHNNANNDAEIRGQVGP